MERIDGTHCYGGYRYMKKISLLFSAGCLGALVNSLVLWQLGQLGVIRVIQVAMNPARTPQWLYPRIVWGGIWGIVVIIFYRFAP